MTAGIMAGELVIIVVPSLFIRLFGDCGIMAMTRLMGMLLMLLIMISVQMFIDGLKSFLDLNS